MSEGVFSHNGTLLPSSEAKVPLDDIAYSYGFGVYETIRVNDTIPFFADQHLGRLLHSAQIIGLTHQFSARFIRESLDALIAANGMPTANAKLLLVGGKSETTANLYMQLHNPLFPDRKLYRDGAHLISYAHERLFPQAKSLNMLSSYLAYRNAKDAGAYDALLVNRQGNITEGTRTNIFAVRDGKLITPPPEQLLLGVMRSVVLHVAEGEGIDVLTEDIPLSGLGQFDGIFVTSTSSKVMPVRSVDGHGFDGIPEIVRTLMDQVGGFLDSCGGILKNPG